RRWIVNMLRPGGFVAGAKLSLHQAPRPRQPRALVPTLREGTHWGDAPRRVRASPAPWCPRSARARAGATLRVASGLRGRVSSPPGEKSGTRSVQESVPTRSVGTRGAGGSPPSSFRARAPSALYNADSRSRSDAAPVPHLQELAHMFERFSNSFALARSSWHVLRTDKKLALFPVISAVAAFLVLL